MTNLSGDDESDEDENVCLGENRNDEDGKNLDKKHKPVKMTNMPITLGVCLS